MELCGEKCDFGTSECENKREKMLVHKNISVKKRLDYLNTVELSLLRVYRLYANKNYYSVLFKKKPKTISDSWN